MEYLFRGVEPASGPGEGAEVVRSALAEQQLRVVRAEQNSTFSFSQWMFAHRQGGKKTFGEIDYAELVNSEWGATATGARR